jgi:5'-3' exonuclease
MVKRYTFLLDGEDIDYGEFYSDTTVKILNKIATLIHQHNIYLLILCSDSGFNYRANSLLDGQYKANRKRAKSLTQEEIEKDYLSRLKNILTTLPCVFVEVNDVEADNIVYFTINYIRNKIDDANFFLLSSDSDFLQLLDKNISIINWAKGVVNVENWKKVHGFDCKYFKPKDYALFKSIVGDTSDNIKGIKSIGWKTALKALNFLYVKLDKELVLDNIQNVINYFTEIEENFELDKTERTFVYKMRNLFEVNFDMINNNQRIISLDMLETPLIAKIINDLEVSFNSKITFNQKEFLDIIKFKDLHGSDVDYEEIKKKNIKSLYEFKMLAVKSEKMRSRIAG